MNTTARSTLLVCAFLAAGSAAAEDRMTTKGTDQSTSEPPTDQPQPPATTARKTKELLVEGYQIRAFSIVPRAIVKGGGSTLDVDAVMIILQKGASLANCYVTYSSFADGSYYNGDVAACTVLQ